MIHAIVSPCKGLIRFFQVTYGMLILRQAQYWLYDKFKENGWWLFVYG